MGGVEVAQRGGMEEDYHHGQVILGSQPPKLIFGVQPPAPEYPQPQSNLSLLGGAMLLTVGE